VEGENYVKEQVTPPLSPFHPSSLSPFSSLTPLPLSSFQLEDAIDSASDILLVNAIQLAEDAGALSPHPLLPLLRNLPSPLSSPHLLVLSVARNDLSGVS
jgi:hypothetical protein